MTLPQNVVDADPHPLSTGPTKWRAERCVTHHHACDCREWKHACEIESLRSRLAAANALLRDTLRQWPSLSCDAFHHRKSDQHGDLDECEPLRRWRALYAEIQAHLQGAGDEA